MAEIIRLKKGLDIPLYGEPTDRVAVVAAERVGVVPDDFPGFTWKLAVKQGDVVKRGTPLLYAKEHEELKIVAPAAGTVEEIRRGERRKIEAVVVRADGSDTQEEFTKPDSPEALRKLLMASGLWAMMRQRPYDVVARPDVAPRDIFITAFDSAPLAQPIITPDEYTDLEEGIKALASLTSGKVYMGVRFGSGISSAVANVVEFQGPHPAGNVGVQIANIRPVNKGETVWALDARTAARIGRLVSKGELDTTATVALTGESVSDPHIIRTTEGAAITPLVAGQLNAPDATVRVISGNVLTGVRVGADGFLRYPYRQITAIPEGDHADEFMGWASLNPKKYSVKSSFPAFLRGLSKPFSFDARIKGGRRAPILSGEIEKVFPMDIYPEFLLKAIRGRDIDRMEQLGIYEVAPEDFALPEFVDTSKEPLQAEVREGLDYLRKELG